MFTIHECPCSTTVLYMFQDFQFQLLLARGQILSLAEASMDVEEIRSLMQELCATDMDMDAQLMAGLHRACAVIEDLTASKCRSIISNAGSRPVVQAFMSDGWSCDIRSRSLSSCDDVKVARSGRLRTEFVVQRTIV